jgi:hypothetical protein
MERTIEEYITSVLGSSVVETVKGLTNGNSGEPDNLEEAIRRYTKRITFLQGIRDQGFQTLSEYNRYKEARDIISKHEEKNIE